MSELYKVSPNSKEKECWVCMKKSPIEEPGWKKSQNVWFCPICRRGL